MPASVLEFEARELQARAVGLKASIRRDRRELHKTTDRLKEILRECRAKGICVVMEGGDTHKEGNHGHQEASGGAGSADPRPIV